MQLAVAPGLQQGDWHPVFGNASLMQLESRMNRISGKASGLPYFFLIMCICVVNFSWLTGTQETGGYDNLLIVE